MSFSDFHVHTVFCDGKNTAEEIVLQAIENGMSEIGFSGHAYMPHQNTWCMSKANTVLYNDTVSSLKEKYADKISVFRGLEQDIMSEYLGSGYDYIIGAVHCINENGCILTVDNSAKEQKEDVKRFFDGDFLSYCEAYYMYEGTVCENTMCNIVAHFDLVTKFNERGCFFDENSLRYKNAACDAIERITQKDVVFEINTGAISRGYRTSPYPSPFILERLKRLSVPVILSSDSHVKENLTFRFEEAEALAKKYKLDIVRNYSELMSVTK